jgi:hypothetical protein
MIHPKQHDASIFSLAQKIRAKQRSSVHRQAIFACARRDSGGTSHCLYSGIVSAVQHKDRNWGDDESEPLRDDLDAIGGVFCKLERDHRQRAGADPGRLYASLRIDT